ncbi:MAG: hypothetical protein IPH89_09215 [Bacteroidetes bacterium]|nr:hypothetical protein [Bacteroidota bacterium]
MKALKFIFLLLLIHLIASTICFGQSINSYKNKQRHGKWIIYYSDSTKQIDNSGRYRKGVPKGIWRYYDANGKIIRKEKFRFNKIYTTHYHSNGKIKKQGKARITVTDTLSHFFYYGYWNVYDSTGVLIKKQLYKDGIKISETNIGQSMGSTNDSLIEVVRSLNKRFYIYSDSLQQAERKSGKNSPTYTRYVSLNNLNALKIFSDIDVIIAKFGYPGKTLVAEEYAIVFSIISAGNLAIKEKYYDLIINAANANELEWKDVAFFVDKVKVAKKQPQIYGTQYKMDEINYKIEYYPIEDKQGLNERRKKTGLEELDLSNIKDNATY